MQAHKDNNYNIIMLICNIRTIHPLSSLRRSLYRRQLTWTVMCWPFRITCSSTTTPNMAAVLGALTPLKVRPLLIWRMVGTFYMNLLFAALLPLSPPSFPSLLLFFLLFRHISIFSFLSFPSFLKCSVM